MDAISVTTETETLEPSLTFVFNLPLSTGTLVEDWKRARVSRIFKADDRCQTGNYHPI